MSMYPYASIDQVIMYGLSYVMHIVLGKNLHVTFVKYKAELRKCGLSNNLN